MTDTRAANVGALASAVLCAVPVVSTATSGGLSVPALVAGVLAVVAVHLSLRLLGDRAPLAAWAMVWLAAFGWSSAMLYVFGDDVLFRSAFAAVLATVAVPVLLAVVHLGPWNRAVRVLDR